jgi:Fanconi anemia group D2 protein
MQRQEVVGSLVTHVGSGVGSKQSEVDAAMRTFSSIISKKDGKESGVSALRPFTPFLTSLLEHLIHMTLSQVRKLFMLLFTVGVDDEELNHGGGVQDGGAINEASIIIKKYLGIHDDYKKRIVRVLMCFF